MEVDWVISGMPARLSVGLLAWLGHQDSYTVDFKNSGVDANVTDFTASDIEVVGGAVSNFHRGFWLANTLLRLPPRMYHQM
jgi:hypothetical protein